MHTETPRGPTKLQLAQQAEEQAQQLAAAITARGTSMLTALVNAGLNPLGDPLNLLTLQLLAPVTMIISGRDPDEGMPEIIQIAKSIDLQALLKAMEGR